MANDTGARVVLDDDVPWAEVIEGIEIRVLRVGGGSGKYTMMMRVQPGGELPTHRHLGDVHAFTLQGRWFYKEYDWVAGPGSYVFEPAGTVHTFAVPEDQDGPTVVSFYVEGPQEMLDDDGEVISEEGADTINGYYATALEAAGIPYPSAVLP